MAMTTEEFESVLNDQSLSFFKNENGYMFPYSDCHVFAKLIEDGEAVLMRGSDLVDLDELPESERAKARQYYWDLNEQMIIGRFVGKPEIYFELGFPIEDGTMTSNQFRRCLSTVVRMSSEYRYGRCPWDHATGGDETSGFPNSDDEGDISPFSLGMGSESCPNDQAPLAPQLWQQLWGRGSPFPPSDPQAN